MRDAEGMVQSGFLHRTTGCKYIESVSGDFKPTTGIGAALASIDRLARISVILEQKFWVRILPFHSELKEHS